MCFVTGNANGVSLSIYLQTATEFYKASESTDVWYSVFHWPSAGRSTVSAAPVVSLKTLDCRQNRLAWSVQAEEGHVGSFIIAAFTKSRLMTVIYGVTCVSLQPTNRGRGTVVIQASVIITEVNTATY